MIDEKQRRWMITWSVVEGVVMGILWGFGVVVAIAAGGGLYDTSTLIRWGKIGALVAVVVAIPWSLGVYEDKIRRANKRIWPCRKHVPGTCAAWDGWERRGLWVPKDRS